ncbi:HAD-IIA family hydrolase [Pontiellaceae bacterium B12219]|nr:HAD-IIA family hydrolase [Pontiellaceae bacterium B12219]
MENLRNKKAFICDMDGVIYHGKNLLPGVTEFVNWLKAEDKKFLFLTNSSAKTLRELSEKLARMGLDVDESHFYTSARATAAFLASQKPGGTAYVIGDAGIINALYDVGYSIDDTKPDYVVVSESDNYDYARICKATKLVNEGAKLIGTNPDLTGPVEGGVMIPSTGALLAPIELATGCKAYYVGKPNPLMMRNALKKLECRREETAIVGDRMDTDVLAGIEAEITTCLVLSGVSTRESAKQFAYCPDYILNGVGDVVPG